MTLRRRLARLEPPRRGIQHLSLAELHRQMAESLGPVLGRDPDELEPLISGWYADGTLDALLNDLLQVTEGTDT